MPLLTNMSKQTASHDQWRSRFGLELCPSCLALTTCEQHAVGAVLREPGGNGLTAMRVREGLQNTYSTDYSG
jgi:hypothetical protein